MAASRAKNMKDKETEQAKNQCMHSEAFSSRIADDNESIESSKDSSSVMVTLQKKEREKDFPCLKKVASSTLL